MFPEQWDSWLNGSLKTWQDRNLLRVLHPTISTGSAVNVLLQPETLNK
jgi:hypothetical protein